MGMELDQNYKRVNVITSEVRKYKRLYSFKTLSAEMRQLEEVRKLSNKMFDVHKNDLTIQFKGASDTFLFSFINDLKNTLPGYIVITSLEVSRVDDIDMDKVNKYLGDPRYSFVDGSIGFEWYTLKNKNDNNDNK